MPVNQFAAFLNEILDLFTCDGSPPKGNEPWRSFGHLVLKGDNVRKYENIMRALLDLMKDVGSTLSEYGVIEVLLPRIREKKIQATRFTDAECDSIRAAIRVIPLEKFRVYRAIYGVTFQSNGPPVHIGDFTIYKTDSHLDEIKKGLANSDALNQIKRPDFLIGCGVEARDRDKAEQLADVLFRRFELIILFLIGRRTKRFEVGILNYTGPQMRDLIVISKNMVAQGWAWQGSLELIAITDPFFCNPSPPFPRLLQLIVKQNHSLEMHILRCAEWTAEAIGDPNEASAFVKAAIALEVLFSVNEKAVIIPSIMAQIAEGCAFLLGDSPASAVEVEREVKHLYGIRSAIVHSGKDTVASDDLNRFIEICRNVVLVLLSRKEFESMDNTAKLADHFRSKKYAFTKAD